VGGVGFFLFFLFGVCVVVGFFFVFCGFFFRWGFFRCGGVWWGGVVFFFGVGVVFFFATVSDCAASTSFSPCLHVAVEFRRSLALRPSTALRALAAVSFQIY